MPSIDAEERPRTDEIVRRLVEPLAARLHHSLRVKTLVVLVPAVVFCSVMTALIIQSGSFKLRSAAFIAAALIAAFLLPLYLIRMSVKRMNTTVEDLVRHAPRYAGYVRERYAASSNALLVRWHEDGRESLSYLSLSHELRSYDGAITVFALPGQDVVAILLGESNLHVSMRTSTLAP